MNTVGKKGIAVLFSILLLILAFIAGIFFAKQPAAHTLDNEDIWTSRTVNIHLIQVDGEKTLKAAFGEEISLPPADEVENYTFIGWKTEHGEMLKQGKAAFYQDTYFAAVYAISLNTTEHSAYLFPNDKGLFEPGAAMTRGETAKMLYSLLSIPIYAQEDILDVTETEDCYEAVSAMKALGVITGVRYHPNDGITKAELLEMLLKFFPIALKEDGDQTYLFSDINASTEIYDLFRSAIKNGWISYLPNMAVEPDHIMTRAETSILMNRILGRSADQKVSSRDIGIFPDLSPDESYYWDMVEACVAHQWTPDGGSERWTGSIPVEKLKEGLFLDENYELYAIDAKGHLVVAGEYKGFSFDELGRYTSGNTDLDDLVRDILPRLLRPDMEREEMLRAAYDYVAKNCTYLRRHYYERLDVSWYLDEAVTMLQTRKGNCYNFAAAFCSLARALGYDAHVYSGSIGNYDAKHAWVDIEIDGKNYMFDPEIEYAYVHTESAADCFMMTPEKAKPYKHLR